MSIANTSLRVTDLNFRDIKQNLTTYLKGKSEFADFDFNGSTLSTILDVLSYNTYYNAFYLNMVANEMYIDSATLRGSVSSLSKALNYLPRSARSSVATLNLTFVPNNSPAEIIIPKYTRFETRIDGVVYEYTTNQAYTVLDDDGLYRKTIDVYEGIALTYTFGFMTGQRPYFVIPLENLDTTSLVVSVRPSTGSTETIEYTVVSDITEVGSTSTVYYVQENIDQFYEIYFGDGVLGKALANGNVVTIIARECSGSAPNGASVFTALGYSGYNKLTPTTRYTADVSSVSQTATDGEEKETLESIKFNAPRSYETQNRLVTESDYKQFLLNNFSDIQSVSLWGGEENDPPYYGKVILSAKPISGFLLSNTRKTTIIQQMKKYNPMSIDVLIIDPSFIYVTPTIKVSYQSTATTLSADALLALVSAKVQSYETNQLSIFGNNFYASKFIKTIDDADTSIVSNKSTFRFEKRFVPSLSSLLTYKIDFKAAIYNPFEGYQGAVASTAFNLEGTTQELYLDDDGYGRIRLYYLDGNTKIFTNTDAGTVNYSTGIIQLNSFIFSDYAGDEVKINIEPLEKDLTPTKSQIVLLSYPQVTLFDVSTRVITKISLLDVVGNDSPVKTDSVLNTVLV